MTDFLLEVFSEEVPAGLQQSGAEALAKQLAVQFAEARIAPAASPSLYYSARHIAVMFAGMPALQPDIAVEKKGPKVDANPNAIEGFCKSAGLTREQLEVRDVKGEKLYYAVAQQQGRPVADVVREIVEGVLAAFVWPKSMRWGANEIRWVRPLHRIVCLLGTEIVPVQFGHLTADRITQGHRFHAPQPIALGAPAEYVEALRAARVVVDPAERKQMIHEQLNAACAAEGVTLKADAALLDEVNGLVEWPVALMGPIEQQFMGLPPELLQTVMRSHQRYFAAVGKDRSEATSDQAGAQAVRRQEAEPLSTKETMAPYFLTVSNLQATDGGKAIVHGNQRVLRARLSDARFFWEQDIKHPLSTNVAALSAVTFHAKLGTVAERVERLRAIAKAFAPYIPGCDVQQADRAAELAKADLVSGMVGEFPELQGIMGSYYAKEQNEPAAVVEAIRDHYKPAGANDSAPTQPVTLAVALADKLDTLTALFAVGEKPTGSRDPYALRRAALGIIRIVLENHLNVPLFAVVRQALDVLAKQGKATFDTTTVVRELAEFFIDRQKVVLKDQDIRHDVIASVVGPEESGNLYHLYLRANALREFLSQPDGENLLQAYRRAANIVAIEQKKAAGDAIGNVVESAHLQQDEERKLFEALESIHGPIGETLQRTDYVATMRLLAGLRQPVDQFFEKVMVNCDDAQLRLNRLRLLTNIRTVMDKVANFSLIEG